MVASWVEWRSATLADGVSATLFPPGTVIRTHRDWTLWRVLAVPPFRDFDPDTFRWSPDTRTIFLERVPWWRWPAARVRWAFTLRRMRRAGHDPMAPPIPPARVVQRG